MAEGTTHRRVKARAAGKSGRTEVRISRKRRVDAVIGNKAVEVETSGQPKRLEMAAKRLKSSGKKQRLLVVPQTHMNKARAAFRSARTSGTVRNLSGTKRSTVKVSSSTKPGRRPARRAPAKRVASRKR